MSLNISSKKGRVVVIYSNFFRKDKWILPTIL
jgi:hypothetical protein